MQGVEVLVAGPPEMWSPGGSSGLGKAYSLPGFSPLAGAGSMLQEMWLHHTSPTLPWVPGVIHHDNSLRIICYSFLPVSWWQLGSCRERTDASPGWASLCSLLSKLTISVASARTHFISAIPWAMLKGQITPLQNEIVMAPLFPSLAVPSLFFLWSSCLWWNRKNMFWFALFLCLFLHADRLSASCPQFYSVSPPPTTVTNSAWVLIQTSMFPYQSYSSNVNSTTHKYDFVCAWRWCQCRPFSTDAWE